MSKKIRGKNVKKVNEHFLGAKLVFCTEQVCYLLKKVIPKSVSKEKKEEYAKKYAEAYIRIDELDCKPVFKKIKKTKSATLWILRLLVPDFLIGNPSLWDNIKALFEHKYFKPLRIAVLAWVFFCIAVLGSNIFFSPSIEAVAEGEAAWYNANWDYRSKITVDNTKVSGSEDLTDFPFYISTTDADWKDAGNGGNVAQADGGDILFTSADGTTKLEHEIFSYTDTTGELVAVVEIPTLDYDEDTEIFIYYGNDAGGLDESDLSGTGKLDVHLSGLSYLSETTADVGTPAFKTNMLLSAGSVTDSSGNGNNGTVTSATDTSGLFGQALDFDGDSGDVTVSDDSAIQNIFDGGGSISTWIYPRNDGEGNNGRIVEKKHPLYIRTDDGSGAELALFVDFDNTNGQWSTTAKSIPLNVWSHVVVTYDADAVGNNPIFYINGTQYTVGSGITEALAPVGTRVTDAGSDLYIGNRSADDRTFDGIIDDLSIWSSGELSQAEVTELYEQESRRGLEWTDTGENVSSGAISDSSFTVLSGSWAVEAGESPHTKSLVNKTAGTAYIESPYAYGIWEFDISHSGSSDSRYLFTASAIGAENNGSQDGYTVRVNSSERILSDRIDSGVRTALMYTDSSTVTADIFLQLELLEN